MGLFYHKGISKNLSQIFVSPYFPTVTFVVNEFFRNSHKSIAALFPKYAKLSSQSYE
jgi:hypothetical protein